MCEPCAEVGSTTDRGWFGGGIYFSPYCEVSLPFAAHGGTMLVVKVLVGGVTVNHGLTLVLISAQLELFCPLYSPA